MPSTFPNLLSLLGAIASSHAHIHGRSLLLPVAAGPRAELRQRGLSTMTYEGCFSSSSGFTNQGDYMYQTSGYCQPLCVNQNDAVLATNNGSSCWCGNTLPPANSKVDDSQCNVPCNGFDKENCGGANFWSVYLSGISSSVPNIGGSSSSTSSTSSSLSSSSTSTSTSTSAPTTTSTSASATTTSSISASISVVTSEGPGHTVMITVPAAQATYPSSTPTADSKPGTSVAGIAAGVVVGVVIIAALIGGLVFWLRRRKQQAAEHEFKRSTGTVDFLRGGREPKLPQTAHSQTSDARLDPTAGKRNSQGSIADEGDYSRRVLRVANPDNSDRLSVAARL
ncbi:hypothetical protein BAUCODRAFT_30404 [Baudoinia panamericana UAMH 10762]|uniref:WSC domain-containing protein n=1 Tax=Baudoinia panamericana (strain UAMH 10762) TaxID=717646 RepID=M2LZ68_BAUPA|nr:uncharacterized protein BAUCODRAFT_30404 [Baudoinia panamericana UAMH 10762]EMC99977.1 hypothetical protein BAUCODRAFT_30404 [Baudoinia panamericana UAMH 10762]